MISYRAIMINEGELCPFVLNFEGNKIYGESIFTSPSLGQSFCKNPCTVNLKFKTLTAH